MKCSSARFASWEPLEPRLQFTVLPTGFTENVVAGDLVSPTAMDVLPDGRVLLTTQTGDLRVTQTGTIATNLALHLDVDFAGERGLLGVAHDPNFASNHFIYLYHTVKPTDTVSTHNQITRYTLDGDTVVPGSAVEILQLNDLTGATNHNGGALHFGTDGMLYVGVGENARPDNSQSIGLLLGKVLRMDVSKIVAGDPVNDVDKLAPVDNPYSNVATGINKIIYATGFRNPFTFAVDPISGQIFVDDVGLDTWEEIDPLIVGRNYGWGKSEGFALTPPSVGPGPYQDPVMAYNHGNATPVTAATGAAIVGGVFYHAPAGATNPFPASFEDKYFFADLGSNFIRVFDPANPGNAANPDTSTLFASSTVNNPVNLAAAPDGGIYYLSIGNGGQLLKISATQAATVPGYTINTGGAADGPFAADSHFSGGHVKTVPHAIDHSRVTHVASDSVYQSYRYGNFTYTLDHLAPGGLFNVLLDFSENAATGPGQRVFNVAINGHQVLSHFDLFDAAGGAFIALQQQFTTAADVNGKIAIAFTTVTGNARVSGITVSPMTSPFA